MNCDGWGLHLDARGRECPKCKAEAKRQRAKRIKGLPWYITSIDLENFTGGKSEEEIVSPTRIIVKSKRYPM